ncbi:hypothetical protein ACFVRU_36445, partial [Streptomyces sp. NPDC057927]
MSGGACRDLHDDLPAHGYVGVAALRVRAPGLGDQTRGDLGGQGRGQALGQRDPSVGEPYGECLRLAPRRWSE